MRIGNGGDAVPPGGRSFGLKAAALSSKETLMTPKEESLLTLLNELRGRLDEAEALVQLSLIHI